ncbi:MAG: shikimate dehydrogenase family protein [Bacteroidia bacterium]|jgi:shikimate dehydrogenase
MAHFYLLGKSLKHTFSPEYFNRKFNREGLTHHTYNILELEDLSLFPDWIKQQSNVGGFNVTIPYKCDIIPYLDALSGVAQKIGVVNTIEVIPINEGNFKLIGHNTDVYGFEREIRPLLKPWMERALILGDGASASTVKYVLEHIGLECQMLSRKNTPETLSWSEVNSYVLKHHHLIVNTTPIGQFPNVDELPELPLYALTEQHLVFDLIYNPERTLLLQKAHQHGAQIQNGFGMLQQQAEKSWQIWSASTL